MTKREQLQLFDTNQVRTVWDYEQEKWYFSIVDVCGILTDQPDLEHSRNYWKVLKFRLKKEGNETVTKCNRLNLLAQDGKKRLTDVADSEQLLRIIQSIPSPKAEPFKLWLAKVGSERLDEIVDPEKAFLRGADYYRAKGYSEGWINQRLQTQYNLDSAGISQRDIQQEKIPVTIPVRDRDLLKELARKFGWACVF